MEKSNKGQLNSIKQTQDNTAIGIEAVVAFACLAYLILGGYARNWKDELSVLFCVAVLCVCLTMIVWQQQMKRIKKTDIERDSLLVATNPAYPVQILVDLSGDSYHYFLNSNFITTPIPRSGKYNSMIKKYSEKVFPDDRIEYLRVLDRDKIIKAFESGNTALRVEYRDMGLDGEYHWVAMHAYKVKNSYDNKIRAILFARITDDEKEKEEMLREALTEKKQELSDVYSALQIGLVKIEKTVESFPLRSANNAFYELIGYTRDQFAEECDNMLSNIQYQPEDYEVEYKEKDDHGGIRISGKYRIVRRDGSLIWARFDATSSLSETDVYYVMLSDITNVIKAEEQLQRQKYYSALADKETPGGVMVFSVGGGRVRPIYVRGDTASMIGYTNDEISSMKEQDIRCLIHEGELVEADKNFIDRMRNHESQVVQQEFRIRCRDGRIIWVMAQGSLVPDYDGDDAYICIFIDITAQKERESEARMRSHTDQLTGALNRSAFIEQMNSGFHKKKGRHALVMLDIDDFKGINDELGHMAGDAALRQTAATLRSALRGEDIIGRIGGDEFLIAMINIPNEEVLRQRCAEICRRVKNIRVCGRQISVSLGVAAYPADAQGFEELYRCADTAMYETKRCGKSGYCIYSSELKAVPVRGL